MKITPPIRVIVLDFDNCIALEENGEGSEEIKDRAWFEVFPEIDRSLLSPVLEEIKKEISEEISGGKGDRKDIIRRVFVRFGIVPVTEKELEDKSLCFNKIVQDGIKKLRIPSSTKEALRVISKRFPIYINTATPSDAAKESLRSLGLQRYIKEVLGRPGTKSGNLRSIIRAEQIQPKELLFVDDKQSGRESALEEGCQFVGIRTKRNVLWSIPQQFQIISSLSELSCLLEKSFIGDSRLTKIA